MKVLLTGANGQLGYDLQRTLAENKINFIPTDISTLDITNEKKVNEIITQIHPDVIVHCAAWTAVDAAEDNKEQCLEINVDGTKYIAKAAAAINARLIYISTDYVFDGTGHAPWTPDSTPNPINIYGLSKYKGELAVMAYSKRYSIVRISWVFGINGRNFIKTMLNLGKTKKEIKVVDDQIGSPTYTRDLSIFLSELIKSNKNGIFHATNCGYCSWFELACFIFKTIKSMGHNEYDDVQVIPIHSSEYTSKTLRPKNSKMDCSKLIEEGFSLLPQWQDAVTRFIKELEK